MHRNLDVEKLFLKIILKSALKFILGSTNNYSEKKLLSFLNKRNGSDIIMTCKPTLQLANDIRTVWRAIFQSPCTIGKQTQSIFAFY